MTKTWICLNLFNQVGHILFFLVQFLTSFPCLWTNLEMLYSQMCTLLWGVNLSTTFFLSLEVIWYRCLHTYNVLSTAVPKTQAVYPRLIALPSMPAISHSSQGFTGTALALPVVTWLWMLSGTGLPDLSVPSCEHCQCVIGPSAPCVWGIGSPGRRCRVSFVHTQLGFNDWQ